MKRRLFGIYLVVALLFFVVGIPLGTAADKKPFKTFGSMILSGIVGAIPETAYGVIDAAAYINETGGIGGRPYVATMEDGRYDVPATLGIYNKYMQSEPADEYLFYTQYNTPALKALQEKVNKEDKIPCLVGSMSALIFDDKVREHSPYYFASGPGYGEMWGVVLKYIKDHHKKSTPPRCAFHYYDNSTGMDPMGALQKYAKKFGVEIVMMEPFAPTAQTFAPAFLKFRKEKIEYVLFWNWSAKIAAKWFQEYRKYLPDVPNYGAHWTAGLINFDLAGEAYDGHHVVTAYPIETETNNKFVQMATEMAKKQNREIRAWQFYFQSWQIGLIPAYVGRQILQKGEPLTRQSLRDGIENIKGYDGFGMFEGKDLSYTTHKMSRARMLKASWKDKTLIPKTEYLDVYEYLGEK